MEIPDAKEALFTKDQQLDMQRQALRIGAQRRIRIPRSRWWHIWNASNLRAAAHELAKEGGSKEEAVLLYKESLKSDPDSASAYYQLGEMLYWSSTDDTDKQDRQALEYYDESIARCPASFMPYWRIGSILARHNQYGDAVRYMGRARAMVSSSRKQREKPDVKEKFQALCREMYEAGRHLKYTIWMLPTRFVDIRQLHSFGLVVRATHCECG